MRGYLITTANAMAPEFPHLQSGPQFTKAQEGGAVRNGGKAGICYHHLPINKVLLTRKAWEGEETTRCLLALVGIKYNGCSAWTGPGMALPQQHPPLRPRITPTCLPRRLFQTAEGTGRAQWSSTLHLSLGCGCKEEKAGLGTFQHRPVRGQSSPGMHFQSPDSVPC